MWRRFRVPTQDGRPWYWTLDDKYQPFFGRIMKIAKYTKSEALWDLPWIWPDLTEGCPCSRARARAGNVRARVSTRGRDQYPVGWRESDMWLVRSHTRGIIAFIFNSANESMLNQCWTTMPSLWHYSMPFLHILTHSHPVASFGWTSKAWWLVEARAPLSREEALRTVTVFTELLVTACFRVFPGCPDLLLRLHVRRLNQLKPQEPWTQFARFLTF